VALWGKAAPGLQGGLVRGDPDRFFVPPCVGVQGWLGVRLEGAPDWDGMGELVADSDCRRLARPLPPGPAPIDTPQGPC